MKILAGLVCAALPLGAAERQPSKPAPTYAREISRIVQSNCEGCHRPGQIGPFPLTNYKEIAAFAAEIKVVTQARRMPPWPAVPGHGEFKNERRLADGDIETITRWVDAGAPMGDARELPPPIRHNDDWAFGKPDLILTVDGDYEISGNGVDEYRCFVVPSGLTETRFIQALEVRPGNRRIVHHVRAFADISGKARELDAADPKPGFDCALQMAAPYKRIGIGGWAPGLVPERHPAGIGRFFPRNSDVVLEVHYHKNGRKESDRSSIGIWLHKETPRNIQRSMPVANLWIRIPAGAERYMAKAAWTTPKDILATSVTPHMHLLGEEMLVTATFADGRKQDLVWAKPYDFNWQTSYVFKEPIRMPKGTRIEVTGYFNNSESNPKNPNKPLREVRWGEGTTDEMLIGFIGYIDDPGPAPASEAGR